jgi:2-dehydro-3-deoxyphosphogluconate aldolase/(4S)-4-hydroxy-2-oxoglutarate aldolase
MKREEVRSRIRGAGVIASIRLESKEEALFAAEALSAGGVDVVEIALTIPGATAVIAELAKHQPHLIVGAGGVLSAESAQTCLDAGALFLSSDALRHALAEFAARTEIVTIPGALTPSEVITAWESGCDFVKVVPCAQIGGESYIRSLHKMFPQIPLIAAGGVTQQTASRYIFAGAVGVGVGHELLPSAAIHHRQTARITELARRFVGFVKSGREGRLPEREGPFVLTPH